MKGDIYSNLIIVGFNTPLTSVDKSSRQKTNKATEVLNYTVDQLDLIDIYRTFHLQTAKYTFTSSVHGTFSRIDNTPGHKQVSTNLRR